MVGSEFRDEVTENEIQWREIVEKTDIRSHFHLLKPLNPLQNRVDRVVSCVICHNPATLQCISCHSNWCSHEHFLLDNEPIHQHICSKVTELWFIEYDQQHQTVKGSDFDQSIQNKVYTGLLLDVKEMCSTRARGYISERNYIMAIAPALRNLTLAKQLFGDSSYEYVEGELMLARAHLGLRKYQFVHKTLQEINISVDRLIRKQLHHIGQQKYNDYPVTKIAKVPRSFGDNFIKFPFIAVPIKVLVQIDPKVILLQGRVYHLQGGFFQQLGEVELSMKYYGWATYYISLASGPTSLQTSMCYLEIAKTLLIGQKPRDLSHIHPFERNRHLTMEVNRSLYIFNIAVDIWNTAIRRQINCNKALNYEYCEIGEPKLLLQDAKAVFAIFLGQDSYQYIKATVALCLLFAMYDGDYEAAIESRVALNSINGFLKWSVKNSSEAHECLVYKKDIRDMMSVLATPEVMRRIADVERDARGRVD